MADLADVVRELERIHDVLADDRKMMWRVLLAVIAGAFTLIGVKIAFP